MLYMLTGEIQTGKTRWLARRVDEARAAGIDVHGVLAPGVWRRLPGGGLEKVGIDNVLLPSGERIHLAVRRDLARSAGREEARGPSERAGLGWAMSSAAVARVDAHFANLAGGREPPRVGDCWSSTSWGASSSSTGTVSSTLSSCFAEGPSPPGRTPWSWCAATCSTARTRRSTPHGRRWPISCRPAEPADAERPGYSDVGGRAYELCGALAGAGRGPWFTCRSPRASAQRHQSDRTKRASTERQRRAAMS